MVNQLRANIAILLLGAIMTVILLFGTNLLLHFNDFSENHINIITFVSSILIFYFVGFISGNLKGKHGLANGIISSILLVVVFVVINALQQSLDYTHIVRYIIMILTGGLGGIIGVNFKPIIKL